MFPNLVHMYINTKAWLHFLNNYSSRRRKILYTGILLFSFSLTFLDIPFLMKSDNNKNTQNIDLIPVPVNKIYTRSPPIILYLHENYRIGFDHFIPNKKTKINCPYKCFHTDDREKYAHIADLRFFDHRHLNENTMPPNNPKAINVYHTFEPPYLTFSIFSTAKVPDNYFNATMTYRSTSEIYYPYDYFVKRDGTETKFEVWTEKQVEAAIDKKYKTALGIMTNCGAESRRHEFIRELQKDINITIIGHCMGNTHCERGDVVRILQWDTKCVKKHLADHYFYLAFENSVCPEYVTEKFYRMRQLVVPIVLSRAAMPHHIPNNTYIAASDFKSPKALVNYLNHLMENREEYKKYFDWTKTYRKSRVREEQVAVSCQLCKMVYKQEVPQISDFELYWNGSQCMKDYGLNLIYDYGAVQRTEQKMKKIMEQTERKRSIGLIL